MGRRLGQHFLERPQYLRRIAALAGGAKTIIEIGAGRGVLTRLLAEQAERLVAIEIDPVLAGRLRERFADQGPRVEIVWGDVLATDLTRWGPAVVTGNLPYYITSPIIERTLAMGRLLERAVFLVQWEVAQRLAARPGTRDYGFLTVATRLSADARVEFRVPAGAFSPPPKVDSAVVVLEPRRADPERGDREAVLQFLGLCFRHKRKTLRNNLGERFGRAAVDSLAEVGQRAEQLDLDQLLEIYGRLTSPRLAWESHPSKPASF